MASNDGPRRLIQSIATIALLSYAGLALALYLLQERMIFFPQPLAEANRARIARRVPAAVEVTFDTPDGVRLSGWLVRAAMPGRAPLVIYFGGNAEEVSWLVGDPLWPPEWSVALINYRGYGASDGAPGERTLTADALLIHDRLRERAAVDPTRIVAFGRSPGSGIAVRLAAERPLAGVVLASAYDSLRAVASRTYPWIPVRWLLRHPFDSLALAPRIRAPLLAVVAGADRIIPPAHSQRLVDAWGGPEHTVIIPGARHNDISEQPAYAASIQQFLAGIASRRSSGT